MTVKINADTSDGLKFVSDTSGAIDLQSNGVTKASLDANGNLNIQGQYSGKGNTPAFVVRLSSNQTISDNTVTKVAFDTEDVDTDSAFASNKFTVPSGKAGLYKIDSFVRADSTASNNLVASILYLYKNGAGQQYVYNNYSANYPRAISMNINTILNLSEGDYVEIYVAYNTVNSASATINSNQYSVFSGHKLIT